MATEDPEEVHIRRIVKEEMGGVLHRIHKMEERISIITKCMGHPSLNFHQVAGQNREEKAAMLMKLDKIELVEMLISVNEVIDQLINNSAQASEICPQCHKYIRNQGDGVMHQLCECGLPGHTEGGAQKPPEKL